jgi:iron complex transport system permease protein
MSVPFSPARKAPRVAPLILLVLWLVMLIGAPLVGSQSISLPRILHGDPTAASIFWQIRLPRVLLSLLGGAALAVSGLGFQTLFRNSLAEPYTLGISSGAALGAVLALRFEGSQYLGLPLVALASFAGAIGATALIVGLALRRQGVETPTLLLAGVAVSLSCGAIILFLQYLADSTQTFRMVRWMMGGLSVVGYTEVLWLFPWVLGGSLALFALRWELNLLLTGEEMAASRGVDLARLRRQVLLATSLMIGALVAVAGPIGFVGLIVPHTLRRFVGHDHLLLVPACVLGGGAFLTLCDAGARTLMAPAELPVGILTALLGGPFFLWLLVWRKRD